MIAATKIELRSLLGARTMRGFLVLGAFSPIVIWLIARLEDSQAPWKYDEVVSFPLIVGIPMVVVLAAQAAITAHRHRVFESYAVTGHPRDLLFAGRVLAAAICAVALTIGTIAGGLVAHALDNRSSWFVIDGYNGSVSVTLGQFLADVGLVLLVLVLLAALVVGLGTLVRNTAATFGILIGAVIIDRVAVDTASIRWSERANIVPLDRAYEVPTQLPDPWWSLTQPAIHLVDYSQSGEITPTLLTGLLLLAVCALATCSGGLVRLVRGDV